MIMQKELIGKRSGENNEAANREKIEVYWQKFPWLGKYLKKEQVNDIFLSEIEIASFLDYSSEYSLDGEHICFLARDGRLIDRSVYSPPLVPPAWGPKPESIEASLHRMKERARNVYLVLSYCESTKAAIIYSSGKLSLLERVNTWAKEEVRAAEENYTTKMEAERNELQRLVDLIDS